MKVYYISPSTIPSRSANSVHVVNMCEALSNLDYDTTLFVHSSILGSKECKRELENHYGVDGGRIDTVVLKARITRGIELALSILALLVFFKDVILFSIPEYIISRNLYGAFLFGVVLRRKVIYETHAPDKGVRKIIQRLVINSKKISTVVISKALQKVISSVYGFPEGRINVMHDAAREGCGRMTMKEKKKCRVDYLSDRVSLENFEHVFGYFGHLYEGRGIEVIQDTAKLNSSFAFIIYGGNENDVIKHQKNNTLSNLFFMGHLPPAKVRKAMAMMDALLMPYQRTVSIGLKGFDTAQWMSPMKLFEYMSVGVPIIASDLPVLHEILQGRINCIFVSPEQPEEWSDAIQLLANDHELASNIAETAYQQFQETYTWTKRAQRMLNIVANQV